MTLDAEVFAPHVRCVGECCGRVAANSRILDRDVAAGVLEQQPRVEARERATCHRQELDVEFDRVERIFADGGRIGQHDGDGLADVADLAIREGGLTIGLERGQRLQPQGHGGNGVADVGRCDHMPNALHLQCRRRVHRTENTVRDGAAKEDRMQLPLQVHVVDELAAPAQKPQVFRTLDRAAYECVGAAHLTPSAKRLCSAARPDFPSR